MNEYEKVLFSVISDPHRQWVIVKHRWPERILVDLAFRYRTPAIEPAGEGRFKITVHNGWAIYAEDNPFDDPLKCTFVEGEWIDPAKLEK